MKSTRVQETGNKPELITEREAARCIRMSAVFLRKARRIGRGPRYVRIGAKTIRYRVSDLKEWIEEQIIG